MRQFERYAAVLIFIFHLLGGVACSGGDVDRTDDNEVITTVTLTVTPIAGGASIVASVDDRDGDGGDAPVVTGLTLPAGMFDMTVKLENKLETPAEDITLEVRDEGAEHQFFFTGSAVNGPASDQPNAPLTHTYADMDSQGLPIGITNKLTAIAGMGALTITLRHVPAVNAVAVKVPDLANQVRGPMGFQAIGGTSDVQVTIPVTVQ